MNFFEQELRKIFEKADILHHTRYVGRACYGQLTDTINAKAEFVMMDISNKYEGIKLTLINKNEGVIDTNTLRFEDLWGKKPVAIPREPKGIVPYIWAYGEKPEWYGYHPTKADYTVLYQAASDYFEMFSMPEINQETNNNLDMNY